MRVRRPAGGSRGVRVCHGVWRQEDLETKEAKGGMEGEGHSGKLWAAGVRGRRARSEDAWANESQAFRRKRAGHSSSTGCDPPLAHADSCPPILAHRPGPPTWKEGPKLALANKKMFRAILFGQPKSQSPVDVCPRSSIEWFASRLTGPSDHGRSHFDGYSPSLRGRR